jgi:hypothetical protein
MHLSKNNIERLNKVRILIKVKYLIHINMLVFIGGVRQSIWLPDTR